MRIGIDAYPLTVSTGGIRRYAIELIRALARIDGNQEYTLYRGGSQALETLGEPVGVRAIGGSGIARKFIDHVDPIGAGSSLDLYHATNYFSPIVERVPSVLSVHDLSVQLFADRHPLKRRVHHRLLPWMCSRAKGLIAISETTKNDLVECFGLDPQSIDVIPLAVGPEFHPPSEAGGDPAPSIPARLTLPDDFLLFVGVLEPRKNLPELIRSTGALRRRGVRAPLVLAGPGKPEYVERLMSDCRSAGLELGTDVLFLGRVSDRDLPALYGACAVFVYPSEYEGFGLPALEAMACGAPCVLGGNSALSELFGDCAQLVDVHSEDSLTTAMEELLEDAALRAKLIEAGLRRASVRTWDDVAAETLRVYTRVAADT